MTGSGMQGRDARAAAVAGAWAAFGRARVSRAVEVCTCPVCMPPAMREVLVRTPAPDLPAEVIVEYTESAHGLPDPPDDLKVLLPRYLELLAEGTPCAALGLNAVLRRFGDALRRWPGLFDAAGRAALDAWLDAMLAEASLPLPDLFEMALLGPFPAQRVTAALDAAPVAPRHLADLAERLTGAMAWSVGRCWPRLPGLERLSGPERAHLADWLNAPAMMERLLDAEAALRPTDPARADAAFRLFEACGRVDPALARPARA